MVYIQHVVYGGLLDGRKPRYEYAASRPKTDWSYAYKTPGAVLVAPFVLADSAARHATQRVRRARRSIAQKQQSRRTAEMVDAAERARAADLRAKLRNALGPDHVYCYDRTLDARNLEVRLLEVEPALTIGAKVKATVLQVSLRSPHYPAYEAVSYCWEPARAGKDLSVEYIELDGQTALFPASAVQALANLRHKHKKRTLWLDAICINQQHESEQQHQVAIMGEIYGRANRVLIWLGEGSWDAALARHSMSVLLKQVGKELPTDRSLADTVSSGQGQARKSHTRLPPNAYNGALQAFFAQRWFTRLWVSRAASSFSSIPWPSPC